MFSSGLVVTLEKLKLVLQLPLADGLKRIKKAKGIHLSLTNVYFYFLSKLI